MKNIIILYHNDLDGFGAAWAAWKKFGNKADYLAADYGKPIPEGPKNKEVYMFDLCFSEEKMKLLLRENKKLIVIDHHISKKEEVKISTDFRWDIGHSGCILSWNYFHKNKKIPKLLKYIEDTDLWKFKIPFTRELMRVLDNKPYDFKLWNKIAAEFENKQKLLGYLREGKVIVSFINKEVEAIASEWEEAVFEKRKTSIVNSPIFGAELGHYLIKKTKNPVAVIWSLKKGKIRVQLRSSNKVDVSLMAKKYGGGGQRRAAGFYLEAGDKIPWRKIKNE